MNLNKIFLAGNLTRDPELKYTPQGTAICKIGLAVNRTWKNDAGEKKEAVVFVDVDFWGKTGETVAQYLKKGSPLFLEGRLKLEQWDDKQSGQKRSKLGVVGESFQFVGSSEKRSEPARTREPAAATTAPTDDDVPF